MRAHELIDKILAAHKRQDARYIVVSKNVRLQPQVGYSGKMAKRAYGGMRWQWRKTRPYAGILDFKVFLDDHGIEHEQDVIRPAVSRFPIETIRRIHGGENPLRVSSVDGEDQDAASCIQAAFVEQELNWGEEEFQLRTYFGRQDIKDGCLLNAAPRDFLMVYIEKCAAVSLKSGGAAADVVAKVIAPFRRKSPEARSSIIMPPIDLRQKAILPGFREYMPCVINGERTVKWVEDYLERIRAVCETLGPNPN